MDGLKKVQVQLLDAETGEVLEDVNPLTDAGCVSYSNDTPTVSAHGGIPAGTTFDNVPVKKVLDDILYPYTKPTISFSANPGGGIKEKGAVLENVALTATITKKSEDIKKVEFLNGSAVLHTISAPKAGGGKETYTWSGPLKVDATLKARVTDAKGSAVDSNSIGYTFVYPIYIGALDAAAANPTAEQIKALEKRVVTKSNQQYTYTITDKRMCIACPPGMTIRQVLDPTGFDSTSAFEIKKVSIMGLDGTAQEYTVLVGAPTSQSNYKMSFNI